MGRVSFRAEARRFKGLICQFLLHLDLWESGVDGHAPEHYSSSAMVEEWRTPLTPGPHRQVGIKPGLSRFLRPQGREDYEFANATM